jgi:parallel beta-helix repeat protein
LTKTLLQQKQPHINWRADDVRKAAVVTLILIGLMTLGSVRIQPIKAEYQGDITINADGSMSPSTAPIERLGDSYILTSNVNGNIAVKTNNIVFDGNGHVISGFQMYSVKNETLRNLIITGGNIGIVLSDVSNVTITNNTITGTSALPLMPTGGINIVRGSFSIISGNNFVDNKVGINLAECSHNVIVENNFTDCSTVFLLYGSSSNTIYHNNFINNTIMLEDIGYLKDGTVSVNIWDDGRGLGNYWSDYLTRYHNATEIDTAGTGDTPYFVRPHGYVDPSSLSGEAKDYWSRLNALCASNIDRYPLMKSFTTTPPKISVQSPLNQTYNDSSVPLTFSVDVLSPDKSVNWTGYSLDGEPNVTVTGSGALTNVTIANMANGVHSVTVYANDTYGNMGASEPVTFTVAKPEPFPATLVVAPVASVAVVGAVLAIYFKKRNH